MEPAPVLDISATCACGGVTLHVRGRVMSMLMCACEDCQRASGTGHSTVALIRSQSLSIEGQVKGFDRPSDSGAIFTRHFCPECGTPLFGQSSRAPDLRMLAVGLFGAAATWFAPNQLIFARSHRDWDLVADHLPRYERYREEKP